MRERSSKVNFFIVLILAVLCFFYAVYLQNRSFIMGYAISIAFVVFSKRQFRVKRQVGYITGLILLLFLLTLTFSFKQGSSSGRMLIYKISRNIFKENYLTGIGPGRFELQYGLYQAEYFKAGHYTTKELLLAGNTYYAFNDYFQFIIEYGIAGIVILIFLFTGIFKTIWNSLKNYPHTPLLIFAVSQLIAVSIAALFTHVFEKLFFQCFFAGMLSIVLYYNNRIRNIKLSRYLILTGFIGIAISIKTYWPHIKDYRAYQKWEEAKVLVSIGYIGKALQVYKDIYPVIRRSHEFLSDYGDLLYQMQEYDQAKQVFTEAAAERTVNRLYMKLAECCQHTGELTKAEQYYLTSQFIVPNRFTTRYALFDFYCKTGQTKKAYDTGKALLDLPVKIPSAQVNVIRESVRRELSLF